LVNANLVTWVHAHRLVILAWTVNDSGNFNQLVRLGVDGITTDNLAILRTLGRPIYKAKIALPNGGVQGGDFNAFHT
jgi:Glycerophosphoryl diester phosphodiesterase family